MSKLVSEKQWLENICYNCNLKGYCELRDKEQYCEWYKRVEKDLEVLDIIEDKLVVANIILNGKIYHTISIPKEINKLTENQYKKIEEWVENENK